MVYSVVVAEGHVEQVAGIGKPLGVAYKLVVVRVAVKVAAVVVAVALETTADYSGPAPESAPGLAPSPFVIDSGHDWVQTGISVFWEAENLHTQADQVQASLPRL